MLNLMCHGPLAWRRPARLGWTLVASRGRNYWQENASSLARFPQMETSWKLQSFRPSWRTYDGSVATRTPSTFSSKNSANLSALMLVEADTGLCHVTRLMKMTARARGHTIFEWTAVVTVLHRFQDRPLCIHTKRVRIARILYRSSIS